MRRIKYDLRLSETLAPYGVGAIVDIRGASLIAPDTSWWDKKFTQEIHCDRLIARLGQGSLREPPTHPGRAATETPGLLYWRFPEWRFCERCTRLSRSTGKDKGKWLNKCNGCKGALVPMRYVAVCKMGSHIQDVPWFQWAHRGRDSGVTETVRHCRAYKELKFVRSAQHGEGLQALQVVCGACKRVRSLSDLVGVSSLRRDGIRCEGRQPWESEGTVCEHDLIAVQRGATSNYIAERISALDIPEEQPRSLRTAEIIRNHMFFGKLLEDNGGPQSDMIADWIAQDLGLTPEEVIAAASGDTRRPDESVVLDLKDGEWAAFLNKLESPGRDGSEGDFVVDSWRVERDPRLASSELAKVIVEVGQVRRVRVVHALKGFRRYVPDARFVPADLGSTAGRQPVYPAVEMYGEGIFLRFNEQHLAEWESRAAVQSRARLLIERRLATPWAQRLDVPEPRFIALHTIAHLLIRRLAYASGYSSASLQERVYASSERTDRTAGILIFTAAGDAQGTLGGLVRLGEPSKLFPLLLAALHDADYCSNDPVCIESDRQGTGSFNLSACHGCALVSETSCETSNRLLDRQLVLGGSDVRGLLEPALKEARDRVSVT